MSPQLRQINGEQGIQLMLDIVDRNVIFSIKPRYADQIITGNKTVELRRRFANETVVGSLAFIYSSSPIKCIVGYARIEDVRKMPVNDIWRNYSTKACISRVEFLAYFSGLSHGYAIILGDAQALPTSVSASELKDRFGFRAPQSYRYATTDYCALIA